MDTSDIETLEIKEFNSQDNLNSKKRKNNNKKEGKKNKRIKKLKHIDNSKKPIRNMVLSIYSFKGGVGKTTISINLCKELLNKKDKTMCLIDLDQQCNVSSFLLEKYHNISINNYLDDQMNKNYDISTLEDREGENDIYTNIQNCMTRLPVKTLKLTNNFDIVTGNIKLDDFVDEISREYSANKENVYINSIRKLITNLRSKYNYVIIDLSPSLNSLNKTVLAYSTFILTVVNPDSYGKVSLKIISDYMTKSDLFDIFKRKNKILGYIMNKCKVQKGEYTSAVGEEIVVYNSICKNNGINDCLGYLELLKESSAIKMHRNKWYFKELPKEDDEELYINIQFSNIVNKIIEITDQNIEEEFRYTPDVDILN